jgi:MYXO-CTERM domain-containing protein
VRPRRIVFALALAALLAAPIAHADGDPASDYLLGQQTFVPPDDGVPAAYAAQLTATVAEAKTRGYGIRVALIGTRYDMGSVTVLWKQPRQYARFLGKELFFVYKGRLLVVMPQGLAVTNGGIPVASDQKVADRISPPGTSGAALAAAATRAVVQLASDHGAVFSPPPLGKVSSSSSTDDRAIIAAAALVVLALVGAVGLLRRRRRA